MAEFRSYLEALAKALAQELPEIDGARTAFLVDELPYEFRWDDGRIFVFCVLAAVPRDAELQAGIWEALLHAQYCFCESGGFSFGLSHDNAFLLLQLLFDTEGGDERFFVAQMDKFVKTANVWKSRLAEVEQDVAKAAEAAQPEAEGGGEAPPPSMFTIRV